MSVLHFFGRWQQHFGVPLTITVCGKDLMTVSWTKNLLNVECESCLSWIKNLPRETRNVK